MTNGRTPLGDGTNRSVPDPGTLAVIKTKGPGPVGNVHAPPRRRRHSVQPPLRLRTSPIPNAEIRKALAKFEKEVQGDSQSFLVATDGTNLRREESEGLVAQIFFPTGGDELGPEDDRTLNKIFAYYYKLLFEKQLRKESVSFTFKGYADPRALTPTISICQAGEPSASPPISMHFDPPRIIHLELCQAALMAQFRVRWDRARCRGNSTLFAELIFLRARGSSGSRNPRPTSRRSIPSQRLGRFASRSVRARQKLSKTYSPK